MTDKSSKMTVGEKFVELLKDAEQNKDGLLRLARYVILNSHSGQTLSERKLPEEPTAINLLAKVAEINAVAGKDVSSDKMLMMIENAYQRNKFGTPKQFKEDFKKAYPKEFGEDKTEKNRIPVQMARQLRDYSQGMI